MEIHEASDGTAQQQNQQTDAKGCSQAGDHQRWAAREDLKAPPEDAGILVGRANYLLDRKPACPAKRPRGQPEQTVLQLEDEG